MHLLYAHNGQCVRVRYMVLGNDGSSAARCEKLGVPASMRCRVRQVRGFGAVGDGGASQDCESGEPTPEPMGSRTWTPGWRSTATDGSTRLPWSRWWPLQQSIRSVRLFHVE